MNRPLDPAPNIPAYQHYNLNSFSEGLIHTSRRNILQALSLHSSQTNTPYNIVEMCMYAGIIVTQTIVFLMQWELELESRRCEEKLQLHQLEAQLLQAKTELLI